MIVSLLISTPILIKDNYENNITFWDSIWRYSIFIILYQYLTIWDVWSSQQNIIETWACSSSMAQSHIFEKCNGNLQPSTAYNLSHRWCSRPWTERVLKWKIQSEIGLHLLRRVMNLWHDEVPDGTTIKYDNTTSSHREPFSWVLNSAPLWC